MQFLSLFFNIKIFIGFINNGIFPSPLSKEEESYYLDLLSVPEEKENARNKLIEHNLRLVAHIVKKYDNTSESNDDLISIGIIGLIKAIDSFKNDKKTKLATYASKCIENEILMTLRKNKHRDKEASLEDTIAYDKDGEDLLLLDIIESDEKSIDEILLKRDRLNKLEKYFEKLEPREKEILTYRFGLFDTPELTQVEIAKKLDISRSYVSRIESELYINFYKNLRKIMKFNFLHRTYQIKILE